MDQQNDGSDTSSVQTDTADALIAAARTKMADKAALEALPLWQKIAEQFPDLPAGPVGWGAALKEAGRFDEADAILSQAVIRFPEDLWAWIHWAQIAIRRSDWAEALRRWQEVRDRFPDVAAGHVGYATALKDGVNLSEADELLSDCVRRFPDDMWAWIHYADTAVRRVNWMDALVRWGQVRDRFPGDAAGKVGYTETLRIAANVRWRCQDLLRLLKPNRVEGFSKARFGSSNDGGYVMVDDFASISVAYSLTTGGNPDWEAAVSRRGVPVHQLDRVADETSRLNLILAEPIDATRGAPRAPGASLILKVDMEGHEWAFFESLNDEELSCLAQIVAKFHFFATKLARRDASHDQVKSVINRIAQKFGVVHVHAKNSHGVKNVANVIVPETLEVTFANRSRYQLVDSEEAFPGPLDAPNDPRLPDIQLGRFIF